MATTVEITGETLGFASLVIGAVGTVVGYVFNLKDRHVERLEKEIDAYRLRINTLQDRLYEAMQTQLAIDRERAGLNNQLARTLRDEFGRGIE